MLYGHRFLELITADQSWYQFRSPNGCWGCDSASRQLLRLPRLGLGVRQLPSAMSGRLLRQSIPPQGPFGEANGYHDWLEYELYTPQRAGAALT